MVELEAVLEALGRLGIAPPDEPGAGDAVLLPHPLRSGDPGTGNGKVSEPNERTGTRGPKEKAGRKRSA
ncbi:hypothetical protein [Frigoriglobus tundricola]|uniref:Uncharacterized protein n=1 Tax=Frigoriglobus tundricola TaxID=2774151 RepID=A0A6M5YIP2_9BACT|nr:hypothetical protein [Frigoriglobus tundricola]QJW93191.1 hypothetical protein FTUN_0696 [Frigoriglobus tundricola]